MWDLKAGLNIYPLRHTVFDWGTRGLPLAARQLPLASLEYASLQLIVKKLHNFHKYQDPSNTPRTLLKPDL